MDHDISGFKIGKNNLMKKIKCQKYSSFRIQPFENFAVRVLS